MKRLCHVVSTLLRELTLADRNANLKSLSEISQVGGPDEPMLILGEAFGAQGVRGLCCQPGKGVPDCGQVQLTVLGHRRLHVVVLDIDGEQAERRDVAWIRRHQDALQPQDVDQPAQQ